VSRLKAPALSRRAVLRGAGVAVTLPFLESLLPRDSRAQQAQPLPRFLPIFFPEGIPEQWWQPSRVGHGADWALSSILAPLAPLKSKLSVLSGFETGSVFSIDGAGRAEPAEARHPAAWLTCQDADALRRELGLRIDENINGVSFDQVLATFAPAVGQTPLASMQLGLATCKGFCESRPCSLLRSVSWRTQREPTYKLVDPKRVFNQLVGAVSPDASPDAVAARNAHRSVLDAVAQSALTVRGKLGRADQHRLDEYLDALRSVEMRVTQGPAGNSLCVDASPPVFPDIDDAVEYRESNETYDRGRHADVMADLLALAFRCNLTRIVSYMLDDERTEFICNHVKRRTFTEQGSTETGANCGSWLGAHRGSPDELASIVYWHVGKVAELCQKLDAIDDGDGKSVLDNTMVFFGSGMSAHEANDQLPSVLIGGGGAGLRGDQHVDLGKRPLRDLYYTLANSVYGMNLESFGINRAGTPHASVSELLT
jgi:hypothetical protein